MTIFTPRLRHLALYFEPCPSCEEHRGVFVLQHRLESNLLLLCSVSFFGLRELSAEPMTNLVLRSWEFKCAAVDHCNGVARQQPSHLSSLPSGCTVLIWQLRTTFRTHILSTWQAYADPSILLSLEHSSFQGVHVVSGGGRCIFV